MMNLPGLLIAPLLAFAALALFLVFWVLVVVCIATASAPGQSPIAPFDNTAAHQQPFPTDITPPKNTTDASFKSKFYICKCDEKIYFLVLTNKSTIIM